MVDHPPLTDAPSRNALYKIHVSLGKIINALDAAAASAPGAGYANSRRSMSRSVSVAPSEAPSTSGRTSNAGAVLLNDEEVIKEEEEDESMGDLTATEGDGGDDDGDDTIVAPTSRNAREKTPATGRSSRASTATGTGDDSLVDDLLSEEDDTTM